MLTAFRLKTIFFCCLKKKTMTDREREKGEVKMDEKREKQRQEERQKKESAERRRARLKHKELVVGKTQKKSIKLGRNIVFDLRSCV